MQVYFMDCARLFPFLFPVELEEHLQLMDDLLVCRDLLLG